MKKTLEIYEKEQLLEKEQKARINKEMGLHYLQTAIAAKKQVSEVKAKEELAHKQHVVQQTQDFDVNLDRYQSHIKKVVTSQLK